MIEREQIEMDVVFVGAGPANLAGALWLKKQVAIHDELVEKGVKKTRKIGEADVNLMKANEVYEFTAREMKRDPHLLYYIKKD